MPRGRPEKPTPSERELEVMSVLWDLGSGTVAEVREGLIERSEFEPAYTTVLTLLRTLKAKGWVTTKNEGRAHRYYPAVDRELARGDAGVPTSSFFLAITSSATSRPFSSIDQEPLADNMARTLSMSLPEISRL